MNEKQLKIKIRIWLVLFIIGLALSGITAFPIETELAFLSRHSDAFPTVLGNWINMVYTAVKASNAKYLPGLWYRLAGLRSFGDRYGVYWPAY